MRKTLDRPRSTAARLASALAPVALMTGLVALGAHWFKILETGSFLVVLGVTAALAVVSALLSLLGILALWRHAAIGGRESVKALVISMLVLAPFAFAGIRWYQLPQLTQVSTDLITPPEFSTATDTGSSGRVKTFDLQTAQKQLDAYPELGGRRYEVIAETVAKAVLSQIQANGWEVLSSPASLNDSVSYNYSARARFPVIGLPSDIVIRIDSDEQATFVDMRAVSLYVHHDLGMNTWLITSFLEDLDLLVVPTEGQILR